MNEQNIIPANQEIIRDENGRFLKGHSGNYAGKPVGTKDYQRRFFEEFIVKPILKDGSISEKDKFQHIIEKLSQMANDGNLFAIKLVLENLMPKKNEVELSGGIGVLTYGDVLKLLKGEKIDKDESDTVSKLTEGNK